MNKFELSLWEDSFLNHSINLYDKENPGKGYFFIKSKDELITNKNYYIWNIDKSCWIFPVTFSKIEKSQLIFTDTTGETFILTNLNNNIVYTDNQSYEEKLLVLANENMQFYQGKIQNICFNSNIDSTHSLTFDIPIEYFDFYSDQKVKNEYLDYLKNKSKLKLFYKDEWYDFIINNKTEIHSKKEHYYHFEANDLVIEELAKNGYAITFAEDENNIKQVGLGTAKELAKKVVEGTEWVISDELTTANFQEFLEKTEYNDSLQQYETIKEPVITYGSHYSPYLQNYVYKTDYFYKPNIPIKNQEDFYKIQINKSEITKDKTDYPIYYTEDYNLTCADSVKNLIASNSNFTTLESWRMTDEENKTVTSSYYPIKKGDNEYNLAINGSKNWLTTNNFTENFIKSQRYVLHIKSVAETNYNIKIGYSYQNIYSASNLLTNNYYVIYTDRDLSMAEIKFNFPNNVEISDIELFPLNIRNNKTYEAIEITQETLGIKEFLGFNCHALLNIEIDEKLNRGNIMNGNPEGFIILPNGIVNASEIPRNKYFIEPFKNLEEAIESVDTFITKLDEHLILEIDEKFLIELEDFSNKNLLNTYHYNEDIIFNENSITESPREASSNDYIIYYNQFEQPTYYIPYNINYKGKEYYKWKKAILQYTKEKVRRINGSKSNRYSLLQDIAEKFEVFVQFKIEKDYNTGKTLYKDNKPIKLIYFVDQVGQQRWSGFKDTVNLTNISRNIISDELVTKMYVEDNDVSYNKDKTISIKLSNLNSTKEGYIYNFQHYLNTGALDQNFIKEFNQYKTLLYSLNSHYLTKQEELEKLTLAINTDRSYLETLQTSLESLHQQIKENKDEVLNYGNYYAFEHPGQYYKASNLIKDYYSANKVRNWQDYILYKSLESDTPYGFDYASHEIMEDLVIINKNYNKDGKTYYVLADYDFAVYRGQQWVSAFDLNDYFKKDSSNEGTYLVKDQKEVFIKNELLPLEKQTYFIKEKDRYVKVDNPIEQDKDKYYIRFLTSTGIQWFKAEMVDWRNQSGNIIDWYFQYAVNEDNQREIRTFEDYYIFIERPQSETVSLESVLLQQGFKDRGIYEILKLQNLEELNSKKAAINDLITEEEKLFSSIQQAKITYYIDKSKYDILVQKINNLLKTKKDLIYQFENKYSYFIKEGTWSDNSYNNNDSYYLDGVCVSNRSALPKVEYDIQVLDLSSIDYFKENIFKVGDETFAIDKEIFGTAKDGTPIKEKILITELQEYLDIPSKNTITVRNYTNRFEDLFERISASITAVESNEATWNKADILNSNGTINSSLLTDINTENTKLVNSAIGLKNNYQIDQEGLKFTNLIDGNYQTKFNSLGLFLTENALRNNQWTTAISAKGINASAITTGKLNTNKITIVSEFAPSQTWSSLGISCYSDRGTISEPLIDNNTFTRLDRFGLYLIQNKNNFGFVDGRPWFLGKTENECLNQIQKDSSVSITKRGFKYNSIIGKNHISIGLLDQDKSQEGIKFTHNGNDIFEISGDINNNYIAQIAGWHFNNNSLWKQLKITSNAHYDVNQAYYNSQNLDSPFIINDFGIGMKNIALQTNGELWCKNLFLEGGEINGKVKIKNAMMGPFRFHGKDDLNNSSELQYIYTVYNQYNKNFASYEDTNLNNDDIINSPSNLLNKDNKFYLGNFDLTTDILRRCKISESEIQNNFVSQFGETGKAGGVILSVGNDFWIHTSGFGYIGGNIKLNGTLYADRISANEINTNNFNIGGQKIIDALRDDGLEGEIVNITNNYLTNNSNGYLQVSNGEGLYVRMGCLEQCHIDYIRGQGGVTHKMPSDFFVSAPVVEFGKQINSLGEDFKVQFCYLKLSFVEDINGVRFISNGFCKILEDTSGRTISFL